MFSQTTKQVVCGGKSPGLETIDISTRRRSSFDFPATVTSVSTLSNGTVVANVRGSGIQLLRLGQEDVSLRQPTPPSLTVYSLDEGRIIATVPTTNDRVILLETATMSRVHSIPDTNRTVLDISLQHEVAVLCFKEWGDHCLQIRSFCNQYPQWTVATKGVPSVGSLSPACTRLVTLHDEYLGSFVYIWDAYYGTLLVRTPIENPRVPRPLAITFDSEDRFYFCDDTHREPYVINAASQIGNPYSHFIIRHPEQRLEGQVRERYYHLDDGHEWVLCGSQRICWVPPGYIGSDPASHCWVGSSLIMVGQDRTLRKLNFLKSSL